MRVQPLDQRNGSLETVPTRLGITFIDERLLQTALTHSSFAHELAQAAGSRKTAGGTEDNQRLEFLGDAILDFVVGEWLYRRYPDANEGELTSLRAHVVRTRYLARIAREIGLGLKLRLGRGEAAAGGRKRAANLCAAFEALVGAIYLDQGLAATQAWVYRFLEARSGEIDAQRQTKDAKSKLQEHAQAQLHATPFYLIVKEEGPDHAKSFTAQVLIDGQVWGEGRGGTKQAAEQAAAQAALRAHDL